VQWNSAHLFAVLGCILLLSCERQNAAEADAVKPHSPAEEFRSLRSASDATDARAEKVVVENPLYFRQKVYYQLLENVIIAKKAGEDSLLHTTLDEAKTIAFVFKDQLNDPFLWSQLQFTTSLSGEDVQTKIAVDSLYRQANDSLRARNYSAANDLFEESIRLASGIEDKRRIVDNRLRQQYMLQRQKRLKESIAYGKKGIAVARKAGYQYRSAWIFHYMALASEQAGNYSAAIDYSNQAAKAAQFTRDDRCLADTRWTAGIALHRLGKYAESISVFKEALQASNRRGDFSIQAKIHNSIAHSHKSLGNYSESEHHYLDSWKIFDEIQRPKGIATTQSNLADLYRVMGAHDEAMQMLKMAYSYYETNEDQYNQIAIVKRMADTYYNQGKLELARESCRSALNRITAQEKAGSDAYALLKPEVYLSMGDIERDMNSTALAMPLYEKALSSFIALDNPFGILEGHLKIGALHLHNQKLTAAKTSLQQAAAIAKRINHPRAMALADFSLGKLFIRQGKYSKADQALLRAINGVEQTRSGLEDEHRLNELQISYFATMQDIYNEMIQLQLKRSNPEKAFYYSEQARSRSLRDLMHSSEQQVLPSVNILNIQNNLNNNTILLEYKFLKGRLAAFIISKDSFTTSILPTSQEQIEASLKAYLHSIDANNYQQFTKRLSTDPAEYFSESEEIARELYQQLLPKSLQLENAEQLVIVPEGILYYLPFAALIKENGAFLIEQQIISYLPTAALLNRTSEHKPKSDWKLLAAATPEMGLPFTGEEIESIGTFFSNKTLLRSMSKLSEKDLLEKFNGQYDVIHLACHAEIDENSPRFSTIFVGPTSGVEKNSLLRGAEIAGNNKDNNLMAHELYRQNLKGVKLFGLSACKSATGRFINGEGMIGFVHPLLSAGAEAVLATLWEISDEHTPKLMREFYTNWIRNDLSRAEALAMAQRTMIRNMRKNKDIKFAHPQLWAAFTLTGAPNQ